MAVPAGVVLLAVAPTLGARLAVGVYALTLSVMFWVSSTYHRGSWPFDVWARWQRRDHWGPAMLAVTWIGAAAGILMKLYRIDLHVLSGVMYLGSGG